MIEHPDVARVLVTKNEPDGSSFFEERLVEAITVSDADGHPLFRWSQLWGTPAGLLPVGPGFAPEPVIDPVYPEVGGIRFLFFTFPPQPAGTGDADEGGARNGAGAGGQGSSSAGDAFTAKRAGMHVSDTIDLVTVLAGEVYMVTDRGDTLVKSGDTVVMNGAWHGWRNESDVPCTVVSTLVGHPRAGE